METEIIHNIMFALSNFDIASIGVEGIILVICWFFAGVVSLSFSSGNTRIWTSISTGSFLIFLSQIYAINPWILWNKVTAFHSITSALAILLIAHGFLEYYIFCRTFEITGSKRTVYFTTILICLLAALLLIVNPKPNYHVLREFKVIETAIWVFLSLFVVFLIFKIYLVIEGSNISKGFVAFGLVFLFIFLWKGSQLYLQIYHWDKEWLDIIEFSGEATDIGKYPTRVAVATTINQVAGYLSGLSVGGTFIYLLRLMR